MRRLTLLATVTAMTGLAAFAIEPQPNTPPVAKGVLTSIELARKTLTIVTAHGPRSFTYTERSYFFQGRDRLSPELLKSGMVVALRYYTDAEGRQVIHRLKVPQSIDPAAPVEVPPPTP